MQPQEMTLVGLLFVLAAGALVVLYYAARYVRAQLGTAQYADLVRTVQTYIQAAEQMAQSGKLAKDGRFDWVAGQIAEKFPQLSKTQIIAYVEGAVYALNAGANLLHSIEDMTEESGKK